MTFDEKDVQEILDRALTRHGNLSPYDVDSAMDRAWENMKPDMAGARDWTIASPRPFLRSVFRIRLAAVAAIVLIAFISLVILRSRTGDTYAMVETSDSEIYRISGVSTQPLRKGARIEVGDMVRSTGQDSAVVSLTDGSRIEMRPQTEFSVERANDGIRINLRKGGLIVNAARQPAGHLYVQTKDVTVSVVGTVFLVNAEEEGSRVAVIEGEVRVQQGTTTRNLLRGEQLATSPRMEPRLVAEAISWSRSAETHVALLQQTAAPTATASKRLEFEVASIRPLNGEEETDAAMVGLAAMAAAGDSFGSSAELRCKGIDRGWSSQSANALASASAVPMGRCVGVTGPGLGSFIRVVRELDYPGAVGTDAQNIPNMPQGWYQLNAKAEDPRTTTRDDLLQMLKSFAIDRLKLKYHVETRTEDGWAVRIAPGGLRIKESSLDPEKNSERTLDCPGVVTVGADGCMHKRTTIQGFFSALAPTNGLISYGKVIDMTGHTGKVYDFYWSPFKVVPPLPGAAAGPRGVSGVSIPSVEYNPPLTKQLEEQFGLTLEKGKVPVQYLVVDHIEKPSEN